jgi:hypothetical protein
MITFFEYWIGDIGKKQDLLSREIKFRNYTGIDDFSAKKGKGNFSRCCGGQKRCGGYD